MNWLISLVCLALALLGLGLRRLYELGRIAGEAYVESCVRFGEVGEMALEPVDLVPAARAGASQAVERLSWANGLQVYSDLFDEEECMSWN